MLNARTHEILFSFDQPDTVLDSLLPILQEILTRPGGKTSQLLSLHSQSVLISDTYEERAQHIAHLLMSSGYRAIVTSTALEAFTLFLRGAFVPFVVILGQENSSNRFFIFRLLQQVTQKYAWEPSLIHLRSQSSSMRLPHTAPLPLPDLSGSEQTTASSLPLPQTPFPLPSSSVTTSPLSQLSPTQSVSPETVQQLPFPPSPPLPSPPPSSLQGLPSVSIQNTPTREVGSGKKYVQKISLEGQSIGRYHMHTLLGSGPLGRVYQTYDRLREQDVVLKAIQMNALPSYMNEEVGTETNFFQQELDLLSKLDHPNILSPLNCGKSYISGFPFVYKTMHYYPEKSLAAWLYQLGTSKLLLPQEVASLVVQVADALQHAHDRDIIYQNFKLTNLLIRERARNTRSLRILLADFGIAYNQALLSQIPESFPYIAPEQWNGYCLPASDQYGLAAIAYELLTGRTLFQGQSEQIMRQLHLTMQPQPPSLFNQQVSPALSSVILRALAKRPEDRFGSIAHFAQALQHYSK